MKARYFFLVLNLVVSLCLSACNTKSELVMKEAEPQHDLPTITVALGMDYHDVEKHSTATIKFPDPYPGDMTNDYHDTYPHQLVYKHPTRGFVLPHMEQFLISAINGRIDAISDRAAITYVTLDQAITWCQTVMGIIDKAGWKRDDNPVTKLYSGDTYKSYQSFDDLRRAFLDKESNPPLRRINIASWKYKQEGISLELERARFYDPVPDDLLKESNYTISVEFYFDCTKADSCVNRIPQK